MAMKALFKRYNLTAELQREIFGFIKDKKDYDNVLKELELSYNQGLWWLGAPEMRFGGVILGKGINSQNKVQFQDYLDDQDVYMQSILREEMLNELLRGFWVTEYDEWDPTEEEMERDEQENYDHYYDPGSSDAMYN